MKLALVRIDVSADLTVVRLLMSMGVMLAELKAVKLALVRIDVSVDLMVDH